MRRALTFHPEFFVTAEFASRLPFCHCCSNNYFVGSVGVFQKDAIVTDQDITSLLRQVLAAEDHRLQEALLRSLIASGVGDRAAEVLGERSLFLLEFLLRS